jgi:uncharacterized SAM-binding protein YcdF (DUF218 family)
MRSRRSSKAGWIFVGAALAALIVFHSAIFGAMGDFLVQDGPPHKADVVLVLAGDFSGERIKTAAQLVRDGYAPKVLVSGPYGAYGYYECDLAIPFAVKLGYPESYFERVPHQALSTKEEAQDTIPVIRREGARSILLVTSDYHTRRAGNIFRRAAPDLTFYLVGAPDQHFTPHGWWRDREGRKVFFFESMKTVAEWLGM